MDEQRAWLKARRKRRLRILAVMLSFCVLFHTYPDILATLSVLAAVESAQTEVRHITGFTALSDEIREQTVPLGTPLSELTLPDTLEAVVTEQQSEDDAENAEDDGKEDSEENDGKEPDGDTTGTEDKDDSTGETEEGEPSDPEQGDTETGGETEDKDAETGDGEDTQPGADGELEETDGTPATENGDEGDTETEKNTGESAPVEEQGESENEQENAPAEEQQESVPAQETHTVTMPEYLSENVIPVQTLENTQTEKQEEMVAIDGVTWQSEPEYDENTEGIYIFTAVLPDDYTLAEGVSLPEITVTVENGIDVIIQTLRDRIAALPEVEEYLATEPDMEDEDAYAEWEEKLYEYAEEALAIREKYEALTEEQQVQILEEELAKLTAWVELAEQLSDPTVMLADDSEHHAGWTALSSGDIELTDGNYYLSSDLSMGTITIKGNVTLCLNGQTLTHSGSTGSVIRVKQGETFTLCDCGGNNRGCITGGKGDSYFDDMVGGGGIGLEKEAHFIMLGGTICGNDATNGGGIYIGESATFEMNGGCIINNTVGKGYGNQTALGAGGAIFAQASSNVSITNGIICENKSDCEAGGIYLSTGAKLILKTGNETDIISITGNIAYDGGGGLYALNSSSTELAGNVTINGNQDENGNPDNIHLKNRTLITVTEHLTGSFGVSTQWLPYDDKTDANKPFITIVQGGNAYKISEEDFACFSSDNKEYSVLMVEDKTGRGKVLVLGNKDTGNLSGIDLSIKDGSNGEEIKLSPDFAEIIYEYAVTVPNSVDAVSIEATPKNADAKVAMTLQNADNATDTTVQADNILLAEGENTIKVNVTEGDASKVYIITITREAPAGNPVTITAYKDGNEWTDSAPVFKLSSDNGSTFVTDLTAVPDGTYSIYYDYDGDTNIDTGVEVEVDGATATAEVHYHTVTFYDGDTILTTPAQQIVLKNKTAFAPATNPTKTGYTFDKWVTTKGGSTEYDFANKAVTDKTAVYASWTAEKYDITYNGMDNATLSSKPEKHTYGTETEVGNPTKTGYTFAGWKVNGGNTATTDLTLGATAYTAAITLTATWTAEQYTITYDENSMDGATLSTKPEKHTYGTDTQIGNPTKEGYAFAGWKVNGSDTATTNLTLRATDYTAAITLTATWTPNTYQVTLDNHGATGGDLTASQNVTYGGKYGTLPVPSKTGYTFKGWYTEENGQGTEVNAETSVTTADNHTLHAYWLDETAPNKPILQENVTLPTDWTNAQDKIPLKLYDGVGVTELWVSIDGNTYTKIDGFTSGTGSMTYDYTTVLEGEREPGKGHTYQFKAKDAAGNISAESDLFTVKLDKTKPVIGTLTYENKAKDFLDWIIGKKSMVVHVPVTDTGSGVDKISYTQTPRNADGTLDSGSAKTETAEVRDGKAKITFAKDFRGTITITCTDKAGNAADSKTIGTEDAGGVIVEDTPPTITTNAKTDYYDTPTDIKVTVKDDPKNAISAGIASITYQVGEDGEEQSVNVAADVLKTEVIFNIPASEIPTGITEITVTATDNAGNKTTTEGIPVKVKGPEKQPAAEIDYRQEKLTKLVPNGKYSIGGTEYTADTEGCIPVIDGWFGTALSIIKKGNGSETTDSPAQSLPIPARPAAPNAPELSTRTDSSITLKTILNAQYRRTDGTENWQDSTAFTGLAQKTIYKFKAYYPATDTSFASLESSEAQIATMPTAPTKDKLVIGYKAETLTLTDGIEAFTDAACTTPVTAGSVTAYMGQTLYIRYPAKGIIPASLTTAVPIPARPAKPTPGKTDASYPTATDGAITGLTSGTTYEYRVKDGNGDFGAWKDATPSGTKIENLPVGEYEIRVKAVETGNASFQSETAAVTIGAKPATKYEKPDIRIDYTKETLTGFAPGAEYTINNDTVTAGADGTLPIKKEWFDTNLSIRRNGNQKDKLDSDTQSLPVPARPAKPTPKGADVTAPGGKGKLTDLTANTAYEVSTDGGKTWTDYTTDGNGQIAGLDPGTYTVRVKAGADHFASENSDPVKIGAYQIKVTFMVDGAVYKEIPVDHGAALTDIPPVPDKENAVGAWFMDGQGTTPAVFTNITADMTVYAVYTKTYTVTLQTGTGYTLSAETGSQSPVKEGGSFTFRFTLDKDYEQTADFAVKVNGTKVELTAQEPYTYTITDIRENKTVTVEGVAEAPEKPKPEPQPAAEINYREEKLTKLVPDAKYDIDGAECTADGDGCIPIDESWFGTTLAIIRKGNGSETADSPAQSLPVPARPATPTPTGVDVTAAGGDGKLTGLTADTAYEVSTDGGNTWVSHTADENGQITGLAPGSYSVRVKAGDSNFASGNSDPAQIGAYQITVTFMVDGRKYREANVDYGVTLTDIPPVPAKENATGAWCMDEQGITPAVFTDITADMTVYAVYTHYYTVTLQGGTGYTLSAQSGSESPVKEGRSFTFRFALSKGYQKTGSFAVRVNGTQVELASDGVYTIMDIRDNKTVTVEGVAKKPAGKPADPGKDKEDGPQPKPDDQTPDAPQPDDHTPDHPTPKPPVNPPVQMTPPAPTPGTTPAEKEPEGRKPGTNPRQEENTESRESWEPEEEPDDADGHNTETPEPGSTNTQTRKADGTDTGQTTGTPIQQAEVELGNGTVIVTVVCEEEKCTAAVADTEAVVKAVLTPDQQALVSGGETIEIRIDVTDISGKVPAQDKEVIASGVEAYQKEVPGLVLGMYVDISMFIKVGVGDWNAVTETDEPIEVVINIPEKLLSDGREYYIIRAHNGEYTFMNDIDDTPETITISTELFSSYAIAYVETDGTDSTPRCGLCHICPTFLGICCFVWMAIIILIMIVVMILLWKKKEERETADAGR